MDERYLELLRKINKFIIKSNRIPILNRLYKEIYYRFIRYTISSFSRFPEIVSIYLDGSISNKSFLPGASDIDLVFIIKNMTPEEEYLFLKSFWKKFYSLKKIFPKLGETGELWVEVYSEGDMFRINKLSSNPSFNLSNWELLYGKELREKTLNKAVPQDILRDSWLIYKGLLWNFFNENQDETRIRNVVNCHLKIKKNLGSEINEDLGSRIKDLINSVFNKKYYTNLKYDLISDAINSFDKYTKTSYEISARNKKSITYINESAADSQNLNSKNIFLNLYTEWSHQIKSIVYYDYCYYVILEDDFNESLVRGIDEILPANLRNYNNFLLTKEKPMTEFITSTPLEYQRFVHNHLLICGKELELIPYDDIIGLIPQIIKTCTFKLRLAPQHIPPKQTEKYHLVINDILRFRLLIDKKICVYSQKDLINNYKLHFDEENDTDPILNFYELLKRKDLSSDELDNYNYKYFIFISNLYKKIVTNTIAELNKFSG